MRNDHMHLGSFFTTYLGHHLAAWRYPETKTEEVLDLSLYKEVAELSEKGKFDMLFIADVLAHNEEDIEYTPQIRLEGPTLMAALTAVTNKIGLASTLSTTYHHPYNVAREFSTQDHLSGGRTAWNIVTSAHDNEAQNYGKSQHLDHSLRYERCEEFVQVTKELWNSWEDDTLLFDREKGKFLDGSKISPIHFEGNYYNVRGPLNIPRSPQGNPVLISAGASPRGQEFAAKVADVFFTIASSTVEEGKAFYIEMKQKVKSYGRDPNQFKIMPGVVPFVGQTQKEAEEKLEHFQELILPELGIGMLSRYLGIDLIEHSPDTLLPEVPSLDQYNGEKGRFKILSELSRKENLTIRQIARLFARGQGHLFVVGSGDQVADKLSEWFLGEACDGFNVKIPYLPGGVSDFVDYVTLELQNRGLFRTDYEGTTLRDHLGLEYPNVKLKTNA
ncbi:LLM class flavin-dependent oxidoreductase [Oceanobacillus polygoni]|uniref:FMN-dependent oxidoreductase (Nitrilotriacetate monooxygenase family) n=1 Tax=Oceanobacillus polygoni TaxID=1235259 RepID=A0A9X0YW41_9BACI|nr:LLM class flavin-dependent oxidoreductase [Oceanobacillus polygoni]MBP2079552.1 FMN-dependent oxidoreductase (nitrilotriacetate monooxygenase family) [Oceanobacillus polygoni]